jgi:hypothetical protein
LSWQHDAASKTVTGALVPATNFGGSKSEPGGDDSTLSNPDNKKESEMLSHFFIVCLLNHHYLKAITLKTLHHQN